MDCQDIWEKDRKKTEMLRAFWRIEIENTDKK